MKHLNIRLYRFPESLSLGINLDYIKCKYDRMNELFRGEWKIRFDITLLFFSVVVSYTGRRRHGIYKKMADVYMGVDGDVVINYEKYLRYEEMVDLLNKATIKATERIQCGGQSKHL